MELPSRKKNRLAEYDYHTPNAYFVTICTENRRRLFWENMDVPSTDYKNMPLSYYGTVAEKFILEIPKHYPGVSVDNYVIMTDHIHLLLQIHTDSNGRSVIAPTVSTVVRMMKSAVTKHIGFSLWQKGFYDHVIRNEKDYQDIWNYIEGNPSKWAENNRCTCFEIDKKDSPLSET